MSFLDSLLSSIDKRLDGLAAEIDQLEAARAALESSEAGAASSGNGATRSRSRRVRPPKPVESSGEERAGGVDAARERAPQASRRRRAASGGAGRSPVGSLRREDLEQILSANEAGLSAKDIAGDAGVGYQSTLRLLRELEAAGRVQREGSRRSTRWRLVSDEHRAAKPRAAAVRKKKAVQSPRRARQRPGKVSSADKTEAPPVDKSAQRVTVDDQDVGFDDQDVVEYLQSWPDRREAERWVPELAKLSPAARDKLRQFLEQEIARRRKGRRVGFVINADRGRPTRSSQRLIDAGFVELDDGRLELTDEGRAAGRLVARRAGGTAPPWWNEVLGPSLQED
jgi:hypothetical protein